MNSVRTFLIPLLLLTPMAGMAAAPANSDLPACALKMAMPGPTKSIRAGNRWAILRRTYKKGRTARLIVRCKINAHHTSLVSDLRDIARKRMHVLRYYREIQLHMNVPAVYYLKSRVHRGRRIISVDAYFATRENEYHLNLVPDQRPRGAIKSSHYLPLVNDMGAILRELRFTAAVRPAITEASYRRRLNWLIFGGFALFAVLLLSFYAVYRGRRKAATRKPHKKKSDGTDKKKKPATAKDADRTAHDDD